MDKVEPDWEDKPIRYGITVKSDGCHTILRDMAHFSTPVRRPLHSEPQRERLSGGDDGKRIGEEKAPASEGGRYKDFCFK
jgi:hypothetical protein